MSLDSRIARLETAMHKRPQPLPNDRERDLDALYDQLTGRAPVPHTDSPALDAFYDRLLTIIGDM